jgi:hypothetical protein
MKELVKHGGPAFPRIYEFSENSRRESENYPGMTLRDYFIAHAPAVPWSWFKPVMPDEPKQPKPFNDPSWEFTTQEALQAEGWRKDPCFDLKGSPRLDSFAQQWNSYRQAMANWESLRIHQTSIQWPAFWADHMLAQRGKESVQS